MNVEEIRRRLKVYIPDTEGGTKEAIVETISRLPEDVREWALTKIFWFCPAECNGMGAPIKCDEQALEHFHDSLQGKSWWVIRMVYIAPHFFAAARDKQTWVMAHEVAHHWLKQEQRLPEGDDPLGAYDNEADNQARAWGFREPHKDSTQPSPPAAPRLAASRRWER